MHNDWIVCWDNGILQLPRAAAHLVQPKQRVTVCQQLDGRLRVFVGDQGVELVADPRHRVQHREEVPRA